MSRKLKCEERSRKANLQIAMGFRERNMGERVGPADQYPHQYRFLVEEAAFSCRLPTELKSW